MVVIVRGLCFFECFEVLVLIIVWVIVFMFFVWMRVVFVKVFLEVVLGSGEGGGLIKINFFMSCGLLRINCIVIKYFIEWVMRIVGLSLDMLFRLKML